MLVTCATGRAYSWAKPVLEAAHFTAPPIIGGGTLILDPDTLEIKHEYYLPQEQLQSIKDILTNYPDVRIIFNDYTEDDYLNGGWELQRLLNSDSYYIMEVIELTHEQADELITLFTKLHGVTSVKMNNFKPGLCDIHVVSKRATKEHAIGILQQELGISKADTIGIGDGYNDFHIFNAVGTKIAVGNAVPELKALADDVIGDVSSDPVAEYLGRFVKDKGRYRHKTL